MAPDVLTVAFNSSRSQKSRPHTFRKGWKGSNRKSATRSDYERVNTPKRAKSLVTEKGEPESWGSLPPSGTRLPCPALLDGVCIIYDFRPLMCHKFGMPLYNPDKPDQIFACELNFKNGEEIEDGKLIQIQTSIHRAWKELQSDYNQADGYRDSKPLTVARAILEDFSQVETASSDFTPEGIHNRSAAKSLFL